MKREVLDGGVFGDWMVLRYAGDRKQLCQCSCGKIKEVSTYSLKSGKSTNCGDKQLHIIYGEKQFKDLTNQVFGELKAIRYLGDKKWLLTCQKGHESIKSLQNLTDKNTCKQCVLENTTLLNELKESKEAIQEIKSSSDMTGKRVNDLTVIEELGKDRFICECVCGVMREIRGYRLRHPSTTSSYKCNHKVIERIIKGKNRFEYEYRGSAEKDIATLLLKKYADLEIHNKTILGGKELDIYIPSIKIAIEFNGNYWHRYSLKSKTYHRDKTIECAKKGIQLIYIFEYEWENIGYRVKINSMLNKIMGNNHILYARKLRLSEVDLKSAKQFEDTNHLQGSTNSKINIALLENDEIVGLMTFGTPRFSREYEYELIRLCTKLNTSIVGGSERMFKYFIKKYKPSSIISYCDISKFTGRVYNKLGFNIIAEKAITSPNYVWVNSDSTEILTRYETMKKDLVKHNIGTVDMTEDEIMLAYNYFKIYDSGNLRLEYINKEG